MGKKVLYAKAEAVLEGTIIEDSKKKQWVVGKIIGQGGFGAIYIGSELPTKTEDKVIKIEPQTNGPLYTEINFYKRVCEEKDITSWMNEKKLKFLGMPRYISAGVQSGNDNRFLIMDRYGDDLHKILMRTDLSASCLFRIAINILDVLEYIHSKDYSHADIKALNILQGFKSTKQVYLLDFGMVSKFSNNGTHRPEKPDPKLKHNGTLEFCPRDSHRGLVSCRRSDIESLMFNLVFWLSWDRNRPDASKRVGYGRLPWLDLIKNLGDKTASPALLKEVADSKERYMADSDLFLKAVDLADHQWSTHLAQLLGRVATLKYTERPDYDGFRSSLAAAIDTIDPASTAGSRSTGLDAYRDIHWDTPAGGTKQTRRTSTRNAKSRKRASTEIDRHESSIDTKPSAKKKRNPAEPAKKRLLATNNNCPNDEDQVPKSVKIEDKIPKSAWSKRAATRIPTGGDSKENEIIPAVIDKSSTKSKNQVAKQQNRKQHPKSCLDPREIVKKPEDRELSGPPKVTSYDDIIPGVKALDRLKATAAAAATRSSPRLCNRAGNQSSSNRSSSRDTQSVYCQTSPSLSTKM